MSYTPWSVSKYIRTIFYYEISPKRFVVQRVKINYKMTLAIAHMNRRMEDIIIF